MKSKKYVPPNEDLRLIRTQRRMQRTPLVKIDDPEIMKARTRHLRLKVATVFVAILIILLVYAMIWSPELAPALLSVVGFAVWRLAGTESPLYRSQTK